MTTVTIPDYVVGTWAIDPVHSDLSFTVRHMMVSKVRGSFRSFSGEIVTAADPLASSATATVDLASVDTNNEQRDAHVRSADFLDVEHDPTMTYRTTGIRARGEGYLVDGELTIKGITRPVPLEVQVNGFGPDAYGGTRLGLSATGEISRKDFDISFNAPLDGGGVVLGDKVTLHLEVEAVLATPAG